MNNGGKSDWLIVPGKPANKGCGWPQPAERVEESGQAKGNAVRHNRYWTQHQTRRPHMPNRCALRALGNPKPATRLYPRQEPNAVVPHAGICAGGGPQGPSLPRPDPLLGISGRERVSQRERYVCSNEPLARRKAEDHEKV